MLYSSNATKIKQMDTTILQMAQTILNMPSTTTIIQQGRIGTTTDNPSEVTKEPGRMYGTGYPNVENLSNHVDHIHDGSACSIQAS